MTIVVEIICLAKLLLDYLYVQFVTKCYKANKLLKRNRLDFSYLYCFRVSGAPGNHN